VKRWILPYAAAFLGLLAIGLPLQVRLDAPRMGSPLVLGPGSTAWVECRASLPWLPSAVILSELKKQWGLALGEGGLRVVETRVQGNRYRFRVDETIPAEPGIHRIPGAAGIWRQGAWPHRFRIVQAGDFHWPDQPDTLKAFVDEMAVLRPTAILFTGDMAYDPDPRWFAMLAEQFGRLESLGIPVISCPGNHERKGWAQYLRSFGPHTFHRVDLGPLAILSLDSAHGRDQFTPSQFRWLREQLDHLEGRTPILQLHHPVFPPGKAVQGKGDGSGGALEAFQPAFVQLCLDKKVPIVLSGHWHQDVVFDSTGRLRDDTPDFPGTKFVVTTALGDNTRQVVRWPHGGYHGYRILEFEEGELLRYTQDLPGLASPAPIASTPLGSYLLKEPRP